MKKILATGVVFVALIFESLAAELDTTRIDELTGLKGKMNEKEGAYKVTFPRNDVKVVVDGWTMLPFMGLSTWPAVIDTPNAALLMRDMIFFEDIQNAELHPAFTDVHN